MKDIHQALAGIGKLARLAGDGCSDHSTPVCPGCPEHNAGDVLTDKRIALALLVVELGQALEDGLYGDEEAGSGLLITTPRSVNCRSCGYPVEYDDKPRHHREGCPVPTMLRALASLLAFAETLGERKADA